MSAGSPNWQKLHEMGRLPQDQRNKVAGLAEIDSLNKRIKELEAEILRLKGEDSHGTVLVNKEPTAPGLKCETEGCDYIATGRTDGIARNVLRMHGRTHEVKKEE